MVKKASVSHFNKIIVSVYEMVGNKKIYIQNTPTRHCDSQNNCVCMKLLEMKKIIYPKYLHKAL